MGLLVAAGPLQAQSPPVQAPIERLGGRSFTVTANDDKCAGLVAAQLEVRSMKRVAKDPVGSTAAPLAVTVQCAGEAPRFEASVSIADATGTVLYKASGRTGAGFQGSQANFIASVVENIFVH